jgi:hypothetical protein
MALFRIIKRKKTNDNGSNAQEQQIKEDGVVSSFIKEKVTNRINNSINSYLKKENERAKKIFIVLWTFLTLLCIIIFIFHVRSCKEDFAGISDDIKDRVQQVKELTDSTFQKITI